MTFATEGTESAAPTAPETPASVPAPETDPTTNLNIPAEESLPEIEKEAEEDVEEFDWNGRKIAGPKGLKDSVLMHADYTKKTQEVAATRKELEQRAKELDEQAERSADARRAAGQLQLVEDQILGKAVGPNGKSINWTGIDWRTWRQTDPVAAANGWAEFQQLAAERRAALQTLDKEAKDRTQRKEQETVNRLKATIEYATQNIKGWNAELGTQLEEYAAREFEIAGPEFEAWLNPKNLRALHKAWLADQLQKQPQAQTATPTPAPLVKVQTRSSPGGKKSLAEMSMEEFVAERKRQNAR